MAIPKYDELTLPLLRILEDGEVHPLKQLYVALSDQFGLSEDERSQLLPSGLARVIVNRVGWARTHLKKAGLVESPKRGHLAISEEGRRLLAENPSKLDNRFLRRFESFRDWESSSKSDNIAAEEAVEETSSTPDELMDAAYRQHLKQVQSDLLETVMECSPYFFEKIVVRLLRAMGYGGVGGQGQVTPKSSDGGIDGIIHEDKLGLDTVVIQAKRWQGTVGRETVQAFVGSMDLHRSRKGVVITTSRFSNDALDYISRIEGKKVVLIDGVALTRFMVDYRVGVNVTKAFELVDISQDFFDEDA